MIKLDGALYISKWNRQRRNYKGQIVLTYLLLRVAKWTVMWSFLRELCESDCFPEWNRGISVLTRASWNVLSCQLIIILTNSVFQGRSYKSINHIYFFSIHQIITLLWILILFSLFLLVLENFDGDETSSPAYFLCLCVWKNKLIGL